MHGPGGADEPHDPYGGGDRARARVQCRADRSRRRAPAGTSVDAAAAPELTPNTGILQGVVDLDARGFLLTDAAQQTSVAGIFAAGDCRAGSTKQAASAAGEGAAVALAVRRYLEEHASGLPSHAAVEQPMAEQMALA